MLNQIENRLLGGGDLTEEEALLLTRLKSMEILDLISVGNRVTRHFRGNRLEICSIINARSGNCSEDCVFCAQSSRHKTGARVYPMASPGDVLKQARAMERSGAKKFSLVASGRGISDRDLEKALLAFELIKRETGLELCASFGIIDENKAMLLKEAGVTMYHHNLETAPSHFSRICSTHTYQDRVNTIKAAQKAGLRVCSGGIIGLGETPAQRVELAFEIKRLGVDSVPINFLNPIGGTPLEGFAPPVPLESLQTLAIFRLIAPRSVIRLCGGRKEGLSGLQALAFMAGADGVMIGDYLTTRGEELNNDFKMFADLGLEIAT
ncbi:MAG: biotin synthase [Peptococcaceae bacterium BICA1-7]|nr:MAG: biotin synthase [Peptococcaceae bacterium BICA1-7]HBV95582.1 biotin synthase BioB [Desulfotomaculum sp.]